MATGKRKLASSWWKFWRRHQEKNLSSRLDWSRMPRHVAIIMDGNGRWARQRGLPRVAGHRAGINALKESVNCGIELGLEAMTFFAFSTENWKRPRKEVKFLMSLPQRYLEQELPNLIKNNVILKMIGCEQDLPGETWAAVKKGIEETAANTGMKLVFALSYGGRADIVGAARRIAQAAKKGQLEPESITEDMFSSYLDTSGLPDPDLLIRPSGELRISNFLLYQLAYSEFWFDRIYWPDFGRLDLLRAILDFQQRDRRYGGIRL